MSDLGEYDLQKEPVETVEPEPSRGAAWMVVAAIVLVLGAGAAFYILQRGTAESLSKPSDAAPSARPPVVTDLRPEPGDNIPLPPLDETDPIVRQLVRQLSAHPTVAAWLATDGLIRNFTVVTANIASGRTPVRHLGRLAPEQPFLVSGPEEKLMLDPRSYARYDDYADAVAAIDARGAARLYATLKPRIEEAHRELGEPEPTFDAVLEKAIAELLATPTVEGPVRLTVKPMSYAYADERLESLSPAQKQLLRMGPHNVAMVKGKLREIAQYLAIPPSRLPAER